MVYREAGIVTTVMIGLLLVGLAIKGDWMEGMHTLVMATTRKITDLYEFQNEFIKERIEKRHANNKTTD